MTPEALAAVEKVKKLLRLAGNNPSQDEAQNALDRAHQILEQHNISISDLEDRKDHARDDTRVNGGLYKWQRQVWKASAELNFCVYFDILGQQRGQKFEHRLVGRAENVVMSQIMAEYLQGAIERIARNWAKENDRHIFAKDCIIFREGMADTITMRLQSLQHDRMKEAEAKEKEAAATGTNAVTIFGAAHREKDMNTDYLNGWEPGTAARHRAEREARMAEYDRKRKEEEAEHEVKMATDPEYAKKWRAEEAKRAKEAEKWWARYTRRKARSNAEDRRKSTPAYKEGRSAGYEVGLDQQVDRANIAGELE